MTEPDPFDLERFVAAQTRVFETVLAELRAGISGISEARAYLAHRC